MSINLEGISLVDVPIKLRRELVGEYLISHSKVSLTGLGKAFNCSFNLVSMVLKSAGIKLLPRSYHTGNNVWNLYNSGEKTTKSISEKTGLSTVTVYQYMNDLGLTHKKSDSEYLSLVNASFKSGCHTSQEIADALKISPDRANYWKKRLNLPMMTRGPKKVVNVYRNMLIRAGLSLEDIGWNEGVFRQAINQYINYHMLYDTWKVARKNRVFAEKEKRRLLSEVAGIVASGSNGVIEAIDGVRFSKFKEIYEDKEAFDKAIEYFNEGKRKSIMFDKVYGIVREYLCADREGKKKTFAEIGVGQNMSPTRVRYVLKKLGYGARYKVGEK